MAGYDEERIARLIAKTQEPHVQALVASWEPSTPEELAMIARIFGGSAHRATPAPAESEAA
jgi:hypothetical protein